MARLVGTAVDYFGATTPGGPHTASSGNGIQMGFITVTTTGTYAQGAANGVQVAAADAFIQGIRRDNKTVALIGAGPADAGLEGTSQTIPFACVVSGSNITMQLTDATCLPANEHAAAVMGTANRPFVIAVCYTIT